MQPLPPVLPSIRILFGSPLAMGPGKARLLELIDELGSISAAARMMRMSYRRAWLMSDAMNRGFREPVIETAAGGRRGGGAALTAFGKEILRRYQAIEAHASRCVNREAREFAALMRSDPGVDVGPEEDL
jgi:molybdate transport system regulatory protein